MRVITGKADLHLTKEETQKDLVRLVGARGLCLDVHGVDDLNQQYDLEVQRADAGAAVVLTGIIAASLILTKGRHSEVKGSQEVTTERRRKQMMRVQVEQESRKGKWKRRSLKFMGLAISTILIRMLIRNLKRG